MRRPSPTLLLLLTACACPPEPLREPALPAESTPLAWDWLERLWPGVPTPAAHEDSAPGFAITLTAFASRIEPIGEPVADLVELVTATQGPAFPGGSLALRAMRWQEGEAVQAFLHTSSLRPDHELQRRSQHHAVAAAGLAARLPLGPAQPELLAVAFADGVRIGLATKNGDLCLLAPNIAAGRAALLALPPATTDGETAAATSAPWLLLAIEVASNRDPAAVADARARATQAPLQPPPPAPLQQQLQLLGEAIGTNRRRPALLAVAVSLDAPWLTDLALAANDDELRRLVRALQAVPQLAELEPAVRDLHGRRSSLVALLELLRRNQTSPALYARTLQQLGAVALDPGALDLLLDEATDGPALDAGLLRENLRALAGRQAAMRLRATEWLAARGTTVPGYDPLGEASGRAAALAQFMVPGQPTAANANPEGPR